MSLNFPILLVQKYLELNGYFVLINYHVHKGESSTPFTDIDILAIRFPNAFEKPIGASCDEFKYHDLLVPTKDDYDYIDIIIGEVKEGRPQDIERISKPIVLEYALNRVGIFDRKVNREIAKKLANRREYVYNKVRIRKMAFCSRGFTENATVMYFKHIIDYINERFQKHKETKLGVHYEDPVLSLFKIAALSSRSRDEQGNLCLFAYGALMNKKILAKRLNLSVEEVKKKLNFRKAVLKGWRRVSNVYSRTWSGYVYNLCEDEKAETEGVLICGLRHEDILRLDQYEIPYTRRKLKVICDNRKVNAYVYIYEERMYAKLQSISPTYYDVVLQAAKELGIKL